MFFNQGFQVQVYKSTSNKTLTPASTGSLLFLHWGGGGGGGGGGHPGTHVYKRRMVTGLKLKQETKRLAQAGN